MKVVASEKSARPSRVQRAELVIEPHRRAAGRQPEHQSGFAAIASAMLRGQRTGRVRSSVNTDRELC